MRILYRADNGFRFELGGGGVILLNRGPHPHHPAHTMKALVLLSLVANRGVSYPLRVGYQFRATEYGSKKVIQFCMFGPPTNELNPVFFF